MAAEVTKLWHLDAIEVFDGFSSDEKRMLERMIDVRTYKKNEPVYNVNDESTRLFFVIKGRIKLGKNSTNGKECIKHVITEGKAFGTLGFIDKKFEGHRGDHAVSMDHDTLIASISNSDFNKLSEKHPELKQRIIQSVIAKYRRLDSRLESIMFKDAKTRLIEFIKELAEDYGMPVGHELLIKHRLTHQEIANITAISRQKITTLLNEMKQDGLIHLERKSLLVHDMDMLK
ncbi:MAG: Crp/Fnr family transcriptional regulator [Brumimicrobium sp.]|nr:Crp/Fnr family transcriptional regulator [Brumimicrobium sp.]